MSREVHGTPGAGAGAAVGTEVCVVGGGPAGLALAVGLARRGVGVVVLEHGGSGVRPFRGESVSPDGVWLLDRLGVLDRVRDDAVEVRRMEIEDGGRRVLSVDFGAFPYPFRHPLEIPQPVLLSALADEAARRGDCTLLTRWSAIGLLWSDGPGSRVTGVRAMTPGGEREVRARLVVGADGRFSPVRRLAGLGHRTVPLERDVVWLRLPFPAVWDRGTYRIRIRGDRNGMFLPSSGGEVRVGFNIPKGGVGRLRSAGIEALHERLDELAPELSDAARATVTGWRDTALLDIFSTRVPRWSRPGLVLIGDAAHTLSPVLGQGVNHALADAVALAPLVAGALRTSSAGRSADTTALELFQRRREGDVHRSRALQLRQERVFTFAGGPGTAVRRTVYRAMHASPALRRRVLEPAYFPEQRRAARAGFRPRTAEAGRATGETAAPAGEKVSE